MSDFDNDWTWALDMLDDEQKKRANIELSAAYAKNRHKDFDEVVSGQRWNDNDLDKIGAAGDPAEEAYRMAKSRQKPKVTPLEEICVGEKAFTGYKK